MITGEENSGSRVAQAYVGRLVTGGMEHLEHPVPADRYPVAVVDYVVGPIDGWHPVGPDAHVDERGVVGRWHPVTVGYLPGAPDVAGGVVVPVDQAGCRRVHEGLDTP